MATGSGSPPMAFLPTPAMSMDSNQSMSPKTSLRRASSLPRSGYAHRVRPPIPESFAPLTSTSRRARSDPPNQVPQPMDQIRNRIASPTRAGVTGRSLSTGILESSRDVLEQQVSLYEHQLELYQRARELWNLERAELLKRIEVLERTVESNRASAPGSSLVSPRAQPTAVGDVPGLTRSPLSLKASNGSSSAGTKSTDSENSDRFWEGAGASSRHGSVTTRSFSNTAKMEEGRLPSISETDGDRPSQLRMESLTSPMHTLPPSSSEENPRLVHSGIDISLVEQGLDGISLKPSALPPAVVAKVLSPTTDPPRSPSPSRAPSAVQQETPVSPVSLLSPSESHLTKDAGHTPLSQRYDLDGALSGEITPVGVPRPAIQPTRPEPPAEVQEPPIPEEEEETEHDPELTGPLHLENHEEHDDVFLKQLDAKLLQEASKIVRSAPIASEEPSEAGDENGEGPGQEEGEPRLRFKRSMNFGSAFGSRAPFG